ncbi:CAP domain-containing protein [Psychrobacter sp. F1192]|uniref:CAP domain-containing protein n=1 Tax=Psychrobacter coccoides TaxID=2818440 RepID=A0ABS3NL38_9GAMM|nr:CAP domain-containing protein [Psychrobacter coccoides]MBO1530120.1 CAP domain-containing protein [Psychrobacter coccoides]
MTLKTTKKSLAIGLFAALFLTACGGGGGGGDGGDSSSNSDDDSKSSTPVKPSEPIQPNAPPENDKAIASNDATAALVASNTISLARKGCGLSGLSDDPALEEVATKHANYIKHVFANSTPTAFNAHYEGEIKDIKAWTGRNNPFFTGNIFEDRITKAAYPNAMYGVTENIGHTRYFSSAGDIATPENAAESMAKSLLAAPYHLRSLMMPSLRLAGTSMVTYTPYGKKAAYNKGYVLNHNAAATSAINNATFKGVFTYPCQDVKGTVTALYNENPNPVKDTGRDLYMNPIGQPVYIHVPLAASIKVSNVKFHDVKRNINVPVQLLDADNDPYKGHTNYQLPVNEAFIMPLTDDLQSCDMQRAPNQSQQCGLYSNSEYRVSFDVLIDNKTLNKQSFTFTTGEVTY